MRRFFCRLLGHRDTLHWPFYICHRCDSSVRVPRAPSVLA